MFYSPFDKKECSLKNFTIPEKKDVKKKVLKLINIYVKKNKVGSNDHKILKKLILNQIETDYLIYNQSKKNNYQTGIFKQKISPESLRIDINRIIHNIQNKSNFMINPRLMTKDNQVILSKEKKEESIEIIVRQIMNLSNKIAYDYDLSYSDKLMLTESSLNRLHVVYFKYYESERTSADLAKLQNEIKLIRGSIINGLLLETGYFRNWQEGLEQTVYCLIQPERFSQPVFKIKRIEDKLYYLLPDYENFKNVLL